MIIHDTQYFSFINTVCHSAGGVRHEIRPIRIRYSISSLDGHEHQSGEIVLLKISSLTKSVILFFAVEIRFEARGKNWPGSG